MRSMRRVSSALVLGSGGIKIAEAAEFDYSGSQALKALREEDIETVLVNPNIATVQTSHRLADRVYLLPLEEAFVEEVIRREEPGGILIGFGGQTSLTVGVSLARRGVLSRHGVQVLGTPIEGIETALSRDLFKKRMTEVGLPTPPSLPASGIEEALENAEELGYPVIVRVSFNLGGRGSIIAWGREELSRWLTRAFAHSPVRGLLVERYLAGWKEVEFEVVRDREGNSVAVACLENVEPMGVHTGDSIVVAPSQTLTDREYQELRDASIRVAEAIGLVGECNVQLALDQRSGDYYVIETNPRMSRSSALASKATGYPLAYIAAKLALGYLLDELVNKVTGSTTAFFEPSLDYVVVKAPRWDLQKFWPVDDALGSEMKSIGEVMAIGRNLEEAMQKAFRMLDIGAMGLVGPAKEKERLEDLLERLSTPRAYWPLVAARAFRLGASVEEVAERTLVDPYFLRVIKRVAEMSRVLEGLRSLPGERIPIVLAEAARMGFSEEQIAALSGLGRGGVSAMLRAAGLSPSVKNIDTLAGEYPAKTNYLYLTYNGSEDDVSPSARPKVIVVGAGGFRIGVSVEFDWAVVSLADALREKGYESIIINCNPETVSTDWDVVDRLYFEELTPPTVEAIASKERAASVFVSSGGQLGNNMASELFSRGMKLVGTHALSIDSAEDRSAFSRIVEELGLKQPPWIRASGLEEARRFSESVGYPVIVRPSYVLSGSSISVAYSEGELEDVLRRAGEASRGTVVVGKFIEDALEVEVDGVSDGEEAYIVPLEHIEPAGVHSGDATIHTPLRKLSEEARRGMLEASLRICRRLGVRGPFNIQFLARGGEVYVLELNLRSSRSMPLSSKAYGIGLMDLAAEVVSSGRLPSLEGVEEPVRGAYTPLPGSWTVKSPQFSWAQLRGAYPCLGPEMRSTGEVAAQGSEFHEALLKSWLSAQPNAIPRPGQIVLVYSASGRRSGVLEGAAESLSRIGYEVYTLEEEPLRGFDQLTVRRAAEAARTGRLGLLASEGSRPDLDYEARRAAVDHNVPLVLDASLAWELSEAMRRAAEGGLRLHAGEMSEYWHPSRRVRGGGYRGVGLPSSS